MKIISLTRKDCPKGTPDTFVLGCRPIENGIEAEDGPAVSDIKYWDSSPAYVRIFNGPLYVVEFEKSTVKRIVPKSEVDDIGVETKKEEEDNDALPGLQKLEKNNE